MVYEEGLITTEMCNGKIDGNEVHGSKLSFRQAVMDRTKSHPVPNFLP